VTGHPRPDAGAAGLLTVIAACAFLAVAVTTLTVAVDLTLTAGRARSAADAAALAAAASSPVDDPGGDPRAAAARAAAANDARLAACCADPRGAWSARAATRAEPRTPLGRALLPAVQATAAAVPEPAPTR
jgi:uncharacterized membrane protein